MAAAALVTLGVAGQPERLVIDAIRARYPDDAILAEESGAAVGAVVQLGDGGRLGVEVDQDVVALGHLADLALERVHVPDLHAEDAAGRHDGHPVADGIDDLGDQRHGRHRARVPACFGALGDDEQAAQLGQARDHVVREAVVRLLRPS